MTLSAAALAGVNVTEWSGVASAAALDRQAGRGNASSTTAATPSITTTNASDVLIAGLTYSGSAASTLSGISFTALTSHNAGSSLHGRAACQITSATGSYQATWGLSSATTSGTAILALKGA
jgi:hypothetical protein